MSKDKQDPSAPLAPPAPPTSTAKGDAKKSKPSLKEIRQLAYNERIFALRTRVAKEGGSLKLLPEEWRELDCPVQNVNQFGGVKREGGHAYAVHLAAAALHGWDLDAYHGQGQRLTLTRAQYDAALRAVASDDNVKVIERERTRRSGRVIKVNVRVRVPCAEALSKFAPQSVRDLVGDRAAASQ
jgi:hypothetical protein